MRPSPDLPCWFLPALLQASLGLAAPAPTANLIRTAAANSGSEYQTLLSSGFDSISGSRGAVASESSVCSRIGAEAIRVGGSAADAMVATTLCVGVIGMYHSGIGGGGFMIVRGTNGSFETIDYRETAPAAAYQDMYVNNTQGSVVGGLAAGVPGELRGLQYLHDKYGVLPWKDLVMPAARVARNGFLVTEDLVRYMNVGNPDYQFLVDDPNWAQDFAPNGTLAKLGDVITRKRYADTLELIANHGVDIFYEGIIGKSLISYIQSINGTMTLDDLKSYNISTKPALRVEYRDFHLYTTSAPSSGAVTLNMLKTLEQYAPSTDKNLTTHRLVEAMKFAYGARQELGDPDFVDYLDEFQKQMISEATARSIHARILDNATQPVQAYDPAQIYTTEAHGTSHITTADRFGMMVSSTTTVNLLFGAKAMTPDTGIIINNEMDDFSTPGRRNSFGYQPSPANFVAPRKRPLSSITPLIVEHAANGTVFFATGAAGGSRIISSTAQVALNVMAKGMSMRDAVAAPRLHHQLMPDNLMLEYGYGNDTFAAMQAKGHNVTWMAPGLSAVQGVMRLWDGTFEAASETRQKNSGGVTV